MVPPESCRVVIPCLDEGPRIAAVVTAVRRQGLDVLVVDDGSSDDTGRRAADAGASVIRNAPTAGKGVALRTGWGVVEQQGATWALCMDGDGQHAAEDIPGFLVAAGGTDAALIVGNRFALSGRMPVLRRATNRLMSRLVGGLVGLNVPDSQCGFRMIRLAGWRGLGLATGRYEIESEMIVSAARAGWRIEFVPVRTIYRDEKSKIAPVRDTCRWLRWYFKAARRSRPG